MATLKPFSNVPKIQVPRTQTIYQIKWGVLANLKPPKPQASLYHASLLVRCHAPQYRHLYVLSRPGAESLSVILCAAEAFASRSLEYTRFPDTE